ncbi:MAG TPA: lipid-A-disaccharide synthase [candidate division WOR-3 bacterium]|uniref:Lipid-A-disaccharide synthase n=1 Tax=candidate division WOR-3 bacterium TaxID=2052148 RepID=A0A7C5HN08_UNCW3|nr:lipid-A-disaccharide synthase [candidate division WOR-3 bacterium]
METLLIAGEPSGDLHGSYLIREFKKRGNFSFWGIGGVKMAEQGMDVVFPMNRLSIFGFIEVVKKINDVNTAREILISRINRKKPDFAVLIDFPGFNISLAHFLKSKGIPVFYFITPQVWAWGGWRIKQIRKYFDHLFVVLPFEEKFFRENNIPATFVGHPLIDIVKPRDNNPIPKNVRNKKVIALLPGSRTSEIKRLLKPMVASLEIIRGFLDVTGVIVLNTDENLLTAREIIGKNDDIILKKGHTYDILSIADAAVITSGTATLEAAIIGTPMVVVYKLSALSYILAKLLAKIKYISLVNLILNKELVPELIQSRVTSESICRELMDVIKRSSEIKEGYSMLRNKLGIGGAFRRTVDGILCRI